MEGEFQADKVEAIYELREAAETKARAEQALEATPSREKRDALLDAQLNLEAKTQDALEACHECGHEHSENEPHRWSTRPGERRGNVLGVDFRPES